jgi:hypothetical protein
MKMAAMTTMIAGPRTVVCGLGVFSPCAAIPLYRRRISRDDIERGKVRYHQVRIFARVFFKSFHYLAATPLQPHPDGRPLWTPSSGAHEPLSPEPLECIIEWANNRIQPAPPSI